MRRVWHGRTQITDTNGDPVVGAKIEFFAQGTANQLDTYSDYALSSANTNPVITDSGGWVTIFLKKNTLYDYTTVDSDDVTIYAKVTNVSGIEPPLTTKGDVFTFDTDFQRLAIGTDTHVLTADSAEATGIKWAAQASDATTTTKGDIYSHDGANPDRLPVGNDHSILSADSGETTGLKWLADLVRASTSGNQAITADTWTTVQFDTETQDSDSIYNNSTYTITIANNGWYVISFRGIWSGAAGTNTGRLLMDGTTALINSAQWPDAVYAGYLVATTTVVAQVQTNQSSLNIGSGAVLNARRIG